MIENKEEKLEKLNKELDRLVLNKKLELEDEQFKRVRIDKILRVYIENYNDYVVIKMRVIKGSIMSPIAEMKIESVSLWDVLKRVIVVDSSNGDNIYEFFEDQKIQAFKVPFDSKKENSKLSIKIKLENTRNEVMLTNEMSSLLNVKIDTKPGIIKEFYKYLINKGLLNHDTLIVTCNDELKNIFKIDSFPFKDINTLLEDVYIPVGYYTIQYTPSLDIKMFDIPFTADDKSQMPSLFNKNTTALEKKIETNKILENKIRRKIIELKEFINDPLSFIDGKIVFKNQNKGLISKFYEDINVVNSLLQLLYKK
ncbi:SNF12 [Hepatospora eriocheir]|uniref:SNF12 n=1 Tax=Hepatospora eriocheir TaxID=1081669 RepID=A0A1X0QCM4_9MICR|nr:SNF12 [Hepatospora eriocheir]